MSEEEESTSSQVPTLKLPEQNHLARRNSDRPISASGDAPPLPPYTNSDFKYSKTIGRGSFSEVFLALDVRKGQQVAIKQLSQQQLYRERKIDNVFRERRALEWCSEEPHPGIMKFTGTFKDSIHLYFILEYASNRNLLFHLEKLGCFDPDCTRFYTAEIISALEFLHHGLINTNRIIHRDLKPENIMLRADMHIMLVDFGSVKLFDRQWNPIAGRSDSAQRSVPASRLDVPGHSVEPTGRVHRSNSFVGTPQYISPEVLEGAAIHNGVDLWALGCIVYQFVTGKFPFWGESHHLIMEKVRHVKYEIPEGFHEVARDLVDKLLVKDPDSRLGVDMQGGYATLRSHPFFNGIDWDTLYSKQPPYLRPYMHGSQDTDSQDYWSRIPTGLDANRLFQLENLTNDFEDGTPGTRTQRSLTVSSNDSTNINRLLNVSTLERAVQLGKQMHEEQEYHSFTNNHVIIKKGLLLKRVGLFSRRRMFLLLEGPRLLYIDPENKELKGEILLSDEVSAELSDFKVFFIHTPRRIYYLIDKTGYAQEWVNTINQTLAHYYTDQPQQSES